MFFSIYYRRENRGLQREQRAVEGAEGRQGGIGPQTVQRAIEWAEGRRGDIGRDRNRNQKKMPEQEPSNFPVPQPCL